jgi:hypothetical protein
MLSLRALQLLLRHFDSIDAGLSRRLLRKRPWPEEALTALLCDLLDGDTQGEEALSYPLPQLLADLSSTDEPLGFRARIETHQYPSSVERYVTQSDLGFVVSYQDQFEPQNSFSSAWLLQAKRLFPSRSAHDGLYDLRSAFSSRDAEQEQRMRSLRDWAGFDFIRYLLYCPRPNALSQRVREALSHHRATALAGNIFDYALGLQLREDVLSANPTTAAGIFIAPLDNCPKNLAEVHRSLFGASIPFAWFLLHHFDARSSLARRHHPGHPSSRRDAHPNEEAIEGLVRGDHRALHNSGLLESISDDTPPRILPSHTLEIQIVCGIDRPRHEPNGYPTVSDVLHCDLLFMVLAMTSFERL